MVKLRRICVNRILPIAICLILILSFCMFSGVFSPKPARALVGEEFILPAFYAWQGASGIFLNTYDDTETDKQYLANGVYNTLVNIANTISWIDNSITWTVESLKIQLASKIAVVFNDLGKGFFKFDEDTSTLFDSATKQYIQNYNLTDNNDTTVVFSSFTGYRFYNGAPLTLADSNWNGGTQFSPTYYTGANGQQFELSLTNNGYKFIDENENQLIGFSVSQPWYPIQYYKFKYNSNTAFGIKVMATNNSNYKTLSITTAQMAILFGDPATTQIGATTGTLVDNPDIPSEADDEYGYVGVPNSVGWTPSTTGQKLLDDLLTHAPDAANVGDDAYTYEVSQSIPTDVPADPDVSSVELPLLGIIFPANWSLNLHGIWYYVRQWISSIGSWFAFMFGVFANLPYSMVVPIYASAVIVIVLGIYKRFFM